ncbi:MAG: hypothetical protein ABL921_01060 [Pirellula sp.]
MDIIIIPALFLITFFVIFVLLRRPGACPECGDALPIFQSPFTKTRRQWLVGGYVCQRCGCATNMAGQKVTADSPPARFPIVTACLLLVAMLGGVGLLGVMFAKPIPNHAAAEAPLVAPILTPGE